MASGHEHRDERGTIVRCYHHCRAAVWSPGFWIGVTVSFPFEHLIWEKLYPFYLLTRWWGL